MPYLLYVTKGYGITRKDIDWGCPKDFEPYTKEKQLEEQKEDEKSWTLGLYIQSAVTTAVEHCLAGKKARTKYIEKPFSVQIEEEKKKENMSEEEKKKRTEAFFMQLKIMGSNFDRKNKKEDSNAN